MPEIQVPQMLEKEDIQRLPTYEREHYVKQMIRETLQLNPNGATAGQIAKSLGLDPRIADKHLAVMLHTNELYTNRYGQTVVFFPNTRALHHVGKNTLQISPDMTIEAYKLRNKLGDFVFIQTKKTVDYREDVGSGILIPTEKFSEFVEYLKQTLTEMMKDQ